jgi:hypothetical protein
MKNLKEIWQCRSGRYSFKRVFATAAFLVGSYLAIHLKDATLTAIFISAATAAAGLGLAEKGNVAPLQGKEDSCV